MGPFASSRFGHDACHSVCAVKVAGGGIDETGRREAVQGLTKQGAEREGERGCGIAGSERAGGEGAQEGGQHCRRGLEMAGNRVRYTETVEGDLTIPPPE